MIVHVLVIQHPGGGTAGVFADEAAARGVRLTAWTPGAGEAEPAPAAGFDALVVLGGDQNVTEAHRFPYLRDEIALLQDALARERPVLGVCLGHQLLAAAAGAQVRRAPRLELGFHPVTRTAAGHADPLLTALPARVSAYHWHSYEVDPGDRPPLAASDVSVQALRFGPAAWGVQFHPEVTEAILAQWYADGSAHPDLRAAGGDPERWLADPAVRADLQAWMGHGRALFGRFLELAAR